MIRVLQVIGGLNRGGAETMLMNIYRSIDRTRVQFDFLVYSDEKQDYEEEILAMGGRVIRVSPPSGLAPFRLIFQIKRVLRQYGPYAAMHAHTLSNSVYPLLACVGDRKILKVTHSHSTQNSTSVGLGKKVYEMLTKKLIQAVSDVWLACGREAGRYLFGKDFEERGKVVPNGICVQDFMSDYTNEVQALKASLGIRDELLIGSVARLEPVKNHALMLRIAAHLRQRGIAFKMLFAGRGSLEESLKREALSSHLEGCVEFLGLRKDVPALLHALDVFLMPSIYEGTPVAMIEAQACGLPCIISTAVPDEGDLSLDLIRKCSLSADVEEWADLLLRHNRKVIAKDIDIENAFCQSGYNVENSASYLLQLYLNA